MPNWVTNVVKAPKHVIEAMTNEKGNVDFSLAIPFPGPNNDWSGIASDAEQAAEIICGIPTSEHPLLRDFSRKLHAVQIAAGAVILDHPDKLLK